MLREVCACVLCLQFSINFSKHFDIHFGCYRLQNGPLNEFLVNFVMSGNFTSC